MQYPERAPGNFYPRGSVSVTPASMRSQLAKIISEQLEQVEKAGKY